MGKQTDICAIYLRLSDEDRNKESKYDDSESIKNQKSLLIDYASQYNFEIYKIYTDDDYSGADISKPRPEYNQLLQDAEDGKFNIVLCKTQSRFTRDMAHVEYYLHNKFIEWGIRFIGVSDGTDTNDIANKKTRQITGLTNEWYLEDLSKNIKSAFEIKKKQGQFVGAYPCYGYIRDPKNKNKLIIDEEASAVVKRIFDMYNGGLGCYAISSILNEEGVLTPSMYKYEKGVFKTPYRKGKQSLKKTLWDNSCVAYILHQRIYTGDMVQNKEGTVSYKNGKKIKKDKSEWIIVENTHDAIISREDFEKAQVLAGTRKRPLKSGIIHPYTGIIRCGECNGLMSRVKDRKTKDGQENNINYRCKLHERAKNHCIGSCITERTLNSIILGKINERLDNSLNGEPDEHLNIYDNIKEQIILYENKLHELSSKIELSNKAITDLYLDKVKKIITEEQFIIINNSLISELNECKKTYSNIEQQIEVLNNKINNKTDKDKILSKYNQPIDKITREIIQEFISVIYVKNTNIRNQKEVVIEWNF